MIGRLGNDALAVDTDAAWSEKPQMQPYRSSAGSAVETESDRTRFGIADILFVVGHIKNGSFWIVFVIQEQLSTYSRFVSNIGIADFDRVVSGDRFFFRKFFFFRFWRFVSVEEGTS